MSSRVLLAAGLILSAALVRVLPHPQNFAPVGAMALFGAAYFRRSWGLALPFIALFLSDLVLNNVVYKSMYPEFKWLSSGWNYLSFAVVFAAGHFFFQKGVTAIKVAGAALSTSLIFFLVSNFSVFVETTMYPKSFVGLLECYTAGLPFLGNTIMGDLVFSGVMFGVYEWYSSRKAVGVRA